jgi:hypothetical protein
MEFGGIGIILLIFTNITGETSAMHINKPPPLAKYKTL